jgi:hypothetical protein
VKPLWSTADAIGWGEKSRCPGSDCYVRPHCLQAMRWRASGTGTTSWADDFTRLRDSESRIRRRHSRERAGGLANALCPARGETRSSPPARSSPEPIEADVVAPQRSRSADRRRGLVLPLAVWTPGGTLVVGMKPVVVALLLPATIVLGIAAFKSHALFPAPSNATAQGIVWHGRTFVTRREFAVWLRSHGDRYAAWAKRHPSLAGAESAGQKSSDWDTRSLAGLYVLLAGIGLVGAFVFRRWPGILRSATDALRGAAARAGPAANRAAQAVVDSIEWGALLAAEKAGSWAGSIRSRGPELAGSFARGAARTTKRGGRPILRWIKSTALLTAKKAETSARTIGTRGPEFAGSLARGAARTTKRGGRPILRWTKSTALVTARKAESWARISGRRGPELAGSSARRVAAAPKRGARFVLSLGTTVALVSPGLSTSPGKTIRRRRGELTWYLATAVLAAGVGVLATVWLNRV